MDHYITSTEVLLWWAIRLLYMRLSALITSHCSLALNWFFCSIVVRICMNWKGEWEFLDTIFSQYCMVKILYAHVQTDEAIKEIKYIAVETAVLCKNLNCKDGNHIQSINIWGSALNCMFTYTLLSDEVKERTRPTQHQSIQGWNSTGQQAHMLLAQAIISHNYAYTAMADMHRSDNIGIFMF